MTRLLATSFVLVALASGCSSAPPAPHDRGSADVTHVVYLRHTDAEEMAQTMRELPSVDALTVTAHAESNTVMIKGEPKLVEQTTKLISHLDKTER